ncbi:MAG: hypothetical protein M5U14_08060 [Acidimicrobiia bacterium]|nr:hypothetical protein [Acidimicrobiia bacterium]
MEAIEIAGGRVTGVRTDAGVFEAPVVVSDAGIQPTVLKLAGPEHFPADYVERVANLEPGWGWASIRYFLSRPVVTEPMVMIYGDDLWYTTQRYEQLKAGEWGDEVIVFVTVPSLFDPTMAPEGSSSW